MRFRVRHFARYRYDAPVALGPHLLRLTPRDAVRMVHGIKIAPEPTFRRDARDADGNRVTRLGFDGKTTELAVEVRFELDSRDVAPPGPTAVAPEACLRFGSNDPAVAATARRLQALAGADAGGFADSLAATLQAAVAHDPHDTGPLRRPGETLARGRGSARDIAALFVDLCRRAGLPARFVAGYWAERADPAASRGARVWAEVLLPGVGWVGYDPTLGGRTGETHVALAGAADIAGTLPVSGSTFGSTFGAGVRLSPQFELTILTPG